MSCDKVEREYSHLMQIIEIALLSEDCLIKPRVDVTSFYKWWLSDRPSVRITGEILGESMGCMTIMYPADWWQQVRLRFLGWLPWGLQVRWKQMEILVCALYPELKAPPPEAEGSRLKLLRGTLVNFAPQDCWVNEQIDTDLFRKWILDEFAVQFANLMLGKYEDINIPYPAGWWQGIKARWFPTWAKRRWPVKYTEDMFNPNIPSTNYSEKKPSLPDEKHFFVVIERVGKVGAQGERYWRYSLKPIDHAARLGYFDRSAVTQNR